MIIRFLLSICILWCPISFASSLEQTLSKLDVDTLTAEFWALNCVMHAQKDNLLIRDCYSANNSLLGINKQLVTIVDNLTADSDQYGVEFYTYLSKIKKFRTRLRKIESNLAIAKKVTGIYNWDNEIYPSYYQQK